MILAYAAEIDYLLCLAQKNRIPTPMVVLVNEAQPELIDKLKQLGAMDYLVRGRVVAGRLYINPGSATLPNNQSTRLGTIGRLDVTVESVSLQLLQLTETGVEPIKRCKET